MEAGFVALIALVAIAIGVMIGVYIGRSRKTTAQTSGVLDVDCSDPASRPGLYLVLYVSVDDVIAQDRVTLDVNVIKPNSQK